MIVGIVGHEERKFDERTELLARAAITDALKGASAFVSGGCHLGGIDIWAEEAAAALGIDARIFLPAKRGWIGGYRERNLQIAGASDVVINVVVAEYPSGYSGMRFDYCYHCHTTDHIKSGGCWTAKRAKKAEWIVIK